MSSHQSDTEPSSLNKNLRSRQDQAAQCLTLYSYDDALKYQQAYAKALDEQLARCDTCIVEYYKARQRLGESLRHDYEEDLVAVLEKSFNDRDIERIERSLDRAERKLRALEPPLRTKDVLDLSEQLGIFEALCNKPFLIDEFLLSKHFQSPFSLMQTNKRLSIPHYVPASTIFLFGKHYERRAWATHVWSKYKRRVSPDDFDFAIRDPLHFQMSTVFPVVDDPADLERVWFAINTILGKFDNNLITHSLRAMDVDLFMVALDNLKYDTSGFEYLLQAIQKLLTLAPKDFWDAMGSISPTTFIEQIFNNPRFDKLMEAGVHEPNSPQHFSSAVVLNWIGPFMASLESAHQARACRSLTFQLLDRLQADRFPKISRSECGQCGIKLLKASLEVSSKEAQAMSNTDRIAAAELLEVVGEHMPIILKLATSETESTATSSLSEASLQLIQLALALDCRCLKNDQTTIKRGTALSEGSRSSTAAIWDGVIKSVERSNVSLARTILIGMRFLVGLESFRAHGGEALSREKLLYNQSLRRIHSSVSNLLEQLSDFRAKDLDACLSHIETASPILSSLLSADSTVYEAAIGLIKNVSAELGRREALRHLLKTWLGTTIDAYSQSTNIVARSRIYGPCPRLLKTSADVLEILCDSQDGLLPTKTSFDDAEIGMIERFWESQWDVLGMIYETTESWSQSRVADAGTLRNFCRDTMEFLERLFRQYSVFENAVGQGSMTFTKTSLACAELSASHRLLRRPSFVLEKMIKWLRLRDRFLLETSAKLTKQILDRLTDSGLKVADAPANFLESVVGGQQHTKTNLTLQERAEIAESLEKNIGRILFPPQVVDLESETPSDKSREHSVGPGRNQDNEINLDAWMANAKHSASATATAANDDLDHTSTPDQDLSSVNKSIEKMKQLKEYRKSFPSKQNVRPIDGKSRILQHKSLSKASRPDVQSSADRASFREKREAEREAKKKRDAEALAMVKKRANNTFGGQTKSEGSGISHIGVNGKDHAPKGPSMMVSSDSESESEGLDEELFGTSKKSDKISDAAREFEKSRAMQLKRGPIKKIRQVRSAKDMRARLMPDLTSLHKTILGWEFFHEGDFPPESSRQDYSFVSNTFRTPNDYESVFQPLLTLEAWQGFQQSKDDGNFKTFELKVASRMNVDAFVELSTTMPMAEAKDVGLGEADIVLISKGKSPARDRNQSHCVARVRKITRKKATMDVIYKVNTGNALISAMVPNATLHAVKVDSITPLEREYAALCGLKYYDLCDEIIKAKPSPLLTYSDQQLAPLISIYDVNSAQAKAIKSAVDNDAFTLIQGPPGSGKTKTIVATVGALLTSSLAQKETAVPISRPQNVVGQRPAGKVASRKLLVCAPSNAAVDELVIRFKQGVKILSGEDKSISVVRLGRSDAINSKVLDVTLEELVNAKINVASGKTTSTGEDIQKLMMSHKAASENLNTLRDQLDALKSEGKPCPPELDRDIEGLKRKKQELSNRIDAARDNGDIAARDAEIRRRAVQQEVLDSCHVICATLSGSGHEMLQNLNIEFETVVIDEAAQSIELSALIPLKYGCSKCILVGDPKQLPPTVLSREAARFQYEQSLFVRMQANHPNDVRLLDTQYRMHPDISLFPSNAFYDGKLVDGPNMAGLRTRPWHRNKILGPYQFFDVQGMHQSAPRGHSLINLAEIEVALKLYERLRRGCPSYDFKGKIGVITPYKSQLRELRSRFAVRYGDEILTSIDFNTTDSFQGRESEVIIFSCVRASLGGGIGFLSDIRRMNVGITRAKCSLWVLGNASSLMRGEYWSRLVEDAKLRKHFTDDMSLLDQAPLSQVDSLPTLYLPEDQDIDMPDAPSEATPGLEAVKENRVLLGPKAINDNISTAEKSQEKHFRPSGGSNGLNDNMNCHFCGSYAHQTHDCDNEEARRSGMGSCHRCGEHGHTKRHCYAPLCVVCGKTGHMSNTCTSSEILSKKDRERLTRKETEHQALLRRAPEQERRKQLGEHGRAVPIVRTTTPSDSEETSDIQQAPGRHALPTKSSQAFKTLADIPNNVSKESFGASREQLNGVKSQVDTVTDRKEKITPSTKNVPSSVSTAPGTSTIIKQGDLSKKPINPRPPPVALNSIRPPKRKKEVDPFIRPRKK